MAKEKKEKYPRGKHPNSLKNLKTFPKGVSGNPAGLPRGRVSLSDAIYKFLSVQTKVQDPFSTEKKLIHLSQEEMIIIKAIAQAREGDAKARQWLIENAYGKLPETLNLEGSEVSKETMSWTINPVQPVTSKRNTNDFQDAEVID